MDRTRNQSELIAYEEAWNHLKLFRPPDYVKWHLKRMVSSINHLLSIADIKGMKVLDLGHNNYMGLLLIQTGIDLTGNLEQGSKDRCSFKTNDGRTIEWNSEAFDLETRFPYEDSSFDMITAFEVIEHIRDNPGHVVSEIKRILKPNGLCYLTTPNINAWTKIMRQFRASQIYDAMPYSQNYGKGDSMCHIYEYSLWELKNLFRSQGFVVLRSKTWDTFDNDQKGIRSCCLRMLITSVLFLLGYFREAALLTKDRGHLIGILLKKGKSLRI